MAKNNIEKLDYIMRNFGTCKNKVSEISNKNKSGNLSVEEIKRMTLELARVSAELDQIESGLKDFDAELGRLDGKKTKKKGKKK